MAKKRLKADVLSQTSIADLKKNLIKYQDDLQIKLREFCRRLAEYGIEIAKGNIASLDAIFTGELINSIVLEEKESTKDRVVFVVSANSSHAIYVEMGTGMVGAESPYPGPLPAVYAQGKTIRQLTDGRYGWFYQRDGQWYFTEGMPSRPFMYFASVEMQQKVVKIAKEVFG